MDERLQRLLGPNRPELSCEQCFDRLPYYVEFEAIPGRTFERCASCVSPDDCSRARDCLGMRAHLEGCPACNEEHETLLALVATETTSSSPKRGR